MTMFLWLDDLMSLTVGDIFNDETENLYEALSKSLTYNELVKCIKINLSI